VEKKDKEFPPEKKEALPGPETREDPPAGMAGAPAGDPADPPQEAGGAAGTAEAPSREGRDKADALAEELLLARAENAAYKSGVRPDAVEDAVYLALRDARRDGAAADEASIAKALEGVLERHPEWKASGSKPKGFRIGAERQAQPARNDDIAKAFGNV